jgi:drug/metabolite transporter (DMT)-like permease
LSSSLPIEPHGPGGGGSVAVAGSPSRHRASGRSGLGAGLALTTVGLWALLPIGLKVALSGMDPLTITWYRFLAAAVVLGIILSARGTLPRFGELDRPHALLLAAATVFLAGNYALYVFGLYYTNAGTAQVIIQVAPLLLALGGVVLFSERFTATQSVGVALLVTGLVVFSHLLGAVDRYYAGIALLVAAAVSWALYGLAQKQLLGRLSSPSIMFCIYSGAAVLFTPLSTPTGILHMSAVQLGALAFCVVNMLVAYGTFAESLAHLEASRVSAILAMVPLATLLSLRVAESVAPGLVGHEAISVTGVIGACLVVAGSLTAALGRR